MQSSSTNLARQSITSSCSASRRLLWRLLLFRRQQPPANGGHLLVPAHPSSSAASGGATTAAGDRANPKESTPPTAFPGFDPTPPNIEPSSQVVVDRPPGASDLPPDDAQPPRPPEMPLPLWPPEDTPPGFMFS